MMKKIRKMLRQQEGFTLVELMVAVVILGILAGIGVQQYSRLQETARKNAHQANIRIIRSAVEMHQILKGEKLDGISDLVPEFLDAVPDSPWGDGDEYKLEVKEEEGNAPVFTISLGQRDSYTWPNDESDDES